MAADAPARPKLRAAVNATAAAQLISEQSSIEVRACSRVVAAPDADFPHLAPTPTPYMMTTITCVPQEVSRCDAVGECYGGNHQKLSNDLEEHGSTGKMAARIVKAVDGHYCDYCGKENLQKRWTCRSCSDSGGAAYDL